MLHGADVLPSIHQTAAALFAGKGGSLDDLVRVAVSAEEAAAGVGVVDLYLKLGFVKSKSECRKLIKGGGCKMNDEKISDENLRLSVSPVRA